jgi:hypothetical protein
VEVQAIVKGWRFSAAAFFLSRSASGLPVSFLVDAERFFRHLEVAAC